MSQATNNFLFNRAWSVTIGLATTKSPPGTTNASVGELARVYASFSVNPAYPPSPLRINFEIDKGYTVTSNKAKIEVYNLSSSSRLLYKQADPNLLTAGYQVLLQAGYSSLSGSPTLVRTIYVGDIRRAINRRSGSDIITSFECGENEKDLLLSTYDQTYPAGATLLQIVNDLTKQLGVPLGNPQSQLEAMIPKMVFNYGKTISGVIKKSLSDVLNPFNLETTTQNNSLWIKPVSGFNGTEVVVLSNQQGAGKPGLTGLIGIPSQNQGIVQFTSLLNPAIFPGSAVQIFSENINGQYFQVRRAKFVGDSHGQKWQVEGEGEPLEPTVVQNPAAAFRSQTVLS